MLDAYCASSGQLVSAAKYSIYFGTNTLANNRVEVCKILDIWTKSLNEKYLGLPAMVDTDHSDCFKHLVDRVQILISGWKEKMLSMGGKETLIKAISSICDDSIHCYEENL
jgi:hypothetical protein